MKKSKQALLEGAGWKVGDAKDFLDLTNEESALVDLKVAPASSLRKRRQAKKLTQTRLANAIGSSQPRVAKMEAAEATVSVDLLIKTLLKIAATRRDLAKLIAAPKSRPSAEWIGVDRTGSSPLSAAPSRKGAPPEGYHGRWITAARRSGSTAR